MSRKTNTKGEPSTDYFKVSHLVAQDQIFKALPPSTQLLYFHLCRLRNKLANGGGTFYRSDRQLQEDSGLAEASIYRGRKQLATHGFIKYQKGKQHIACVYTVLNSEEQIQPPSLL